MDIRVEKVARVNGQATRVEIMAGGILFRFYLQLNGRMTYTKSKPEARIHNPSSCWVTDVIFRKVYILAAGILKPRKKP